MLIKILTNGKSHKFSLFLILFQAKIARLAKKFGEANQASENKRKQEVRNVVNLWDPSVSDIFW